MAETGIQISPELGRGLTWRSWLILIFAAVVIQPAIIYFYLVSGMGLPVQTWVILLAALEIAYASGRPLSLQETFILTSFTGASFGAATGFIGPIRTMYFGLSPVTAEFGITTHLPSWWAPLGSTAIEIFTLRSFFHGAWALPFSIGYIFTALTLICDISLGFILYEVYAVTEKLDFPAVTAGANTIVTLTERKAEPFRLLLIMIMFGILYNIFTFLIPFAIGNPALQIIPRGLFDLTHNVETSVPGSTFGITTDVMVHLVGFLLPVGVALSMFIGAFAVYFFGNYYVTVNGMWPSVVPWHAGMGMQQLVYQSQLYFWFSAAIGLALAAFIIPIASRPSIFTGALKSLATAARERRPGKVSPVKLFALFFAASGVGLLITHLLAPDFPIWIIVVFSIGGSLFASFVATYSMGVTAGGFGVPYLQQTMIYYSGYRGWNIWFAPVLQSAGGPGFAGALVQAKICRTPVGDYIKAMVGVTVLATVCSFIYVSVFWKVAPIPGSAYPYTVTGWPAETLAWTRWFKFLWSGYIFHDSLIVGSFIAGAIIYLVTDRFIHAPYALIALLTGTFIPPPLVVGSMSTGILGGEMTGGRVAALSTSYGAGFFGLGYGPIPTTLAQLLGSLLGRYILQSRFGKERWREMAPLIVMGFGIGDGMLWAMSFAGAMIGRALWLLPY